MMRGHRSLLAATLLMVTLTIQAPQTADYLACSAMVSPAYARMNPTNNAQLVTHSRSEADNATGKYGFNTDLGVLAKVSKSPKADLVGVHRLYNQRTRDFVYLTDVDEIAYSVNLWGYADQGVVFYAAPGAHDCTVPVVRYLRGPIHRLATEDKRVALEADGWVFERVAFHARSEGVVVPRPVTTTPPSTTAPAADDDSFSFAVMPDTQNETYSGEVRMQERVKWLVANKDSLDLRWVLHTGDVHNWPTPPDNIQFSSMSSWLRPLDMAGLPYILSVGNHDTAAVCKGGSACKGRDASLGLRNTLAWNTFYSAERFGFEGVFEFGKSDNGWRTFSAGGKNWLVLSLELWPRTAVVDWAKQVVASHPTHNVILVTHSFLDADGQLSTSNGGYGANSPAVLWNALDDYPNVVMTFSGHVGGAASTSLTAPDGHLVATYLQDMADPALNPTRIVTVDTGAGTISTSIIANYDRTTGQNVAYEYTQYRATISGMRFVG